MKVFEGRSRLIMPILTGVTFVILTVAAIIFMATRQPEAPIVPQRFVQSTVVMPKYTEASRAFNPEEVEKTMQKPGSDCGLLPCSDNKFGPFERLGPVQVKKTEIVKPVKKYDWVAPAPVPRGTGKVVIIIDDMGVDKRSAEVIALRAPLTLAFLPYARNLPAQTAKAKAGGHELMIHVPMQPKSGTVDPGPHVLTTAMSQDEVNAALEGAFRSFSGYIGINNHMGSQMTEDSMRMGWVMEALRKRGLIFIDSMTSPKSVGAKKAREYGLAYDQRDVFLDHQTDLDSVRASLRQLEAIAYKNGSAIAIGHPKDNTIAALKEWLPTLKDKGLTLVPVSAVVNRPIIKTASPAPFGPPLPQRE